VLGAAFGSSAAERMPEFLRVYALGLSAILHVFDGQPSLALALIQGRASSEDHAQCFPLQRASAYLQLGEDRQALAATDGCVALGAGHSLATFPSVLLRRAIAYERIGAADAADAAFEQAFQLIHVSGAATPMLNLPAETAALLSARLRARRPELAAAIDRLDELRAAIPRVNAPSFVAPILSRREAVIARHLRTEETAFEIADALYVSHNTVKTQIRSLYAKLGVTSREQAVALLERAGFYLRPEEPATGE